MQDIAAVSDTAISIDLDRHTQSIASDDAERRQKAHEAWKKDMIEQRTAKILADKDYASDLFAYVAERADGNDILWNAYTGKGFQWFAASNRLTEAITEAARTIAESEVSVVVRNMERRL